MKPRSNLYEERVVFSTCSCVRVKRQSVTCHVLQHDVLHKAAIISVALRVLSAAVVHGAAAAGGAADSVGSRVAAAFRASYTVRRTNARRSQSSGTARHWDVPGCN